MTCLLAVAEWLCGADARRSVFEPMVADWDRELRQSHTAVTRTAVIVRGSLAFMLTLASCGVRHALTEDSGMWKYSVAAFVVAVGVAVGAEMAIIDARTPADFPPDVLLVIAVRIALAAAVASAMLPALLLLRRQSRSALTASLGIAGGALLTAVAIVSVPSPDSYQLTAEQNEQMYQRALANDRAGRRQYPGTASRELRTPSTPESRRADYERFMIQMNEMRAKQSTPTMWRRIRNSQAPLLAVLFGIIGWNLGAVIRPTLFRAAVWWGVAWFAMLAVDGRLGSVLRLSGYDRPARWVLPALITLAAAALMAASWRRSTDRSPNQLITSS